MKMEETRICHPKICLFEIQWFWAETANTGKALSILRLFCIKAGRKFPFTGDDSSLWPAQRWPQRNLQTNLTSSVPSHIFTFPRFAALETKSHLPSPHHVPAGGLFFCWKCYINRSSKPLFGCSFSFPESLPCLYEIYMLTNFCMFFFYSSVCVTGTPENIKD